MKSLILSYDISGVDVAHEATASTVVRVATPPTSQRQRRLRVVRADIISTPTSVREADRAAPTAVPRSASESETTRCRAETTPFGDHPFGGRFYRPKFGDHPKSMNHRLHMQLHNHTSTAYVAGFTAIVGKRRDQITVAAFRLAPPPHWHYCSPGRCACGVEVPE